MKKNPISIVILLCISKILFAQSVTIDPRANSTPIVTIQSSNEGLLLPTNSNPAVNIINPPNGTMVYNSSSNTPNFYNGTQWQSVTSSTAASLGFTNMITFGDRYTSVVQTQWTVPAGVYKIMIESWDEGSDGDCYVYNNGPRGKGGKAGNYNYGIYNVIPNQILRILIGADSEAINSTTNEPLTRSNKTKLIEGESGYPITITYGMPVAGKYHTVFNMGDGGDAFNGGKGGKGSSWINENEIFKYRVNWDVNGKGSFPGGGGGAGYCFNNAITYSYGGNGLVIIYY